MLPMVKADAYGLGMTEAVSCMEGAADPWGFGVATVEEGLRLLEQNPPQLREQPPAPTRVRRPDDGNE